MRRHHPHPGFTLVELLVSIAIALVLVLGINQVFKATSQTVGAGESLLNTQRDGRTVLQTFLNDTANIDPVPAQGSTTGDGPFFMIQSQQVPAFRNAADQQQQAVDAPGSPNDPSTDPILFKNFAGGRCPVPLTHFRSHRIDKLMFFSKSVYPRQMSSDGSRYVSTTTASEACTYYGHALQPNKGYFANPSNPTWYAPAQADTSTTNKNDNNKFAADWMLSRLSMVMIPQPIDRYYFSDAGGLSPFLASNLGVAATVGAPGTPGAPGVGGPTDLAAISIASYGSINRINGISNYSQTWTPPPNSAAKSLYGNDWWDPIVNFRFQASPFVPTYAGQTTAKITPAALAQSSPDLIRGCSQFIVEYAGNYYTKDASKYDGSPFNPTAQPQTVPVPDPTGQLDYYGTLNPSGQWVRQIRWYGFPRAVNAAGGTLNTSNGDVLPLRDALMQINLSWGPNPGNGKGMAVSPANTSSGLYADAERFSSNFPPGPGKTDMTAMDPTVDEGTNPYLYTAAWGPDVHYQAFPKLIRIIIEIDDHEGRLSKPQRFEFVYDVSP